MEWSSLLVDCGTEDCGDHLAGSNATVLAHVANALTLERKLFSALNVNAKAGKK